MTNTTRPTAKAIRKAARTITTSPNEMDRLVWLRENAPEIAAYVEAQATTQLSPQSAEYARTAINFFGQLVRGR